MNAARITHPTHGPAAAKTVFPTGGGARSVVAVKVVTLRDAFAAPASGEGPKGATGPYGPAA
ncbi:hypothetical protein GCM10010222_09650 [Streptomyces tanashiensis]|uniref:hypothetical protein n=1 Tax=Streptomyces tanashiensis TaxID=67367 RepID=UPI0016727C74|nr:hypothetical protein [Streptomyces tanashiensis]GGS70681.1 hypothetical protein GCM10010222_09650 [Streptomyces tanashiensis]